MFGHMLFWVSYMHVFYFFVFALVQRSWSRFTRKGALEIHLLFLSLSSSSSSSSSLSLLYYIFIIIVVVVVVIVPEVHVACCWQVKQLRKKACAFNWGWMRSCSDLLIRFFCPPPPPPTHTRKDNGGNRNKNFCLRRNLL